MFKPRAANAPTAKSTQRPQGPDRRRRQTDQRHRVCNRKSDVDVVAKSLKKYGYDAAPITAIWIRASAPARSNSFRNGEAKLLIASDVAARGLDVPSVGHVFNASPAMPRITCTASAAPSGRAGPDGKALTICNPRDVQEFRRGRGH
ncbi:MAG: helicase-related protein [Paracoccaceae bacterium]